MFENEWFPKANAMGVSWQEFWEMNPHIIKLIAKGHQEKITQEIKRQDMLNWYLGQYVMSALDSTVCNSGLWRKKGAKPHTYIEKPVTQKIEEKKGQTQTTETELTDEEKKRQTEQLFMRLRIMGANFNLNHKT